jgi:hypothetical protein
MADSAAERPVSDGHVVEETNGEVRLVSMTSAYYVDESNRGDVAVNASFIGVWPARFMAQHRPRALIGVDCGIGKDGAGIAGLWYLEALAIPAVAAAVTDVELLNGADVLHSGIVSRRNDLAGDCGVEEGMSIAEAARLLMLNEPRVLDPEERGRRTVVAEHPSGRNIVCTHSIAFPLSEDRDHNVLCTGGFAGAPNIVKASPYGFICSDGGRGRDDSGLDGLRAEIPGAVVDVQTARMGDGLSTYHEGVISACNDLAAARGVKVGQRAEEAAWLLVSGE